MKWLFEINRIKKKNKMEGGKMKSGFIAIVGRPNVGKSTLMNKLVKEKVAIVSDKAGTTRDQIRGIVNIQDNQYIFVDTPGIHKPKHLLGEHMTEVALETLNDVDLIMFMLDGSVAISTGDIFVSEHIKEANTPVIVIINKIVVETIREKILHHTKDEIPHSVAVEIINVETKPNIRKYDVNIYVERDSQKGIIIGKDGALLKKIGIEARREIEALIDLKVNLKLWVKVKKKWRKNKQFLDEMGYKIKKK